MSESLPHGWRSVPLGNAVVAVLDFRGRTPKKLGMDWGGGDIPALSAVNVRAGRLDLTRTSHFGSEALYRTWMTQGDTAKGDILITTEAPLGNVAQVPDDRKYILSQRVILLKTRSEMIDANFLAQQMRGPAFQSLLDDHRSGTTATGIRQSRLVTIPIQIPPLREQRRIVAKLEALQARSRRAREALDAVPPLLEKLRQSILAAAFRGDLTKDWRAKNKDVEPATKLLERIRLERRKKWEESELAKMKAKGKPPTDDKWKSKYKEPSPVDAAGLPELPHGWCWASVDDVSDLQLGQQRAPNHAAAEETHPYIRTANITWDGLDLSDVKRMGFPDPERYRLRAGDVLLSEASGSPTEVGKPAIWREEIPGCCYQKTLLRARPRSPEISSEWLHLCFLADALLGRFARMAPGVGILHLTADRMLSWPVAIPPLEEQARVLELATASLGTIAKLEDSLGATSAYVATFERAVLARAFSGELVPQDPSEEPTEMTLSPANAMEDALSAGGTARPRKGTTGARHDEA